MAYVGTPFAHDLFISYSHGYDEKSGIGFLQAWSTAFTTELERELRADRRFRHDLAIFLDGDHRPGQGIDPMSPLTEQLRQEIGNSALLVILMSPDYLASTWCADEREWWSTQQASFGLPCDERIAVVRIWPTDTAWPKLLTDSQDQPLVGFRFHAPLSGKEYPLGWVDMPGPFQRDFRKALLDIVTRVYPKLDALKQRLEERQRLETEAGRLAQESGQTIYLHGRASNSSAWEKAAIALTDSGFMVLPGEPDALEHDPQKLQSVREQRVETLTVCDALLILGSEDGRALDSDLVVLGKHDRQSARARCNRLLPCGLIDTVGATIATPVRKASARVLQADWLDGTQITWPQDVKRWLDQKSALLGQQL
ncbi:toll/interleukin-1 receptor domain-containing protein [Pseudomonas sp. CCOS 191]|uniref:toll/interleukin-1 receptor domain-containing protein n=1 Tax=Pseudomonas sp. CCOS 191 TaxID=1649877 RepID=UPI00062497E2|nr:toll/interleukin-1 receptor domain-containing protein [Pseudomonas sp. CCOS 191]CRI57073.1 molecular chaperone Tir [Pseudomonas sp. CCOS 191]